jgi:hypothetical protein
MIFRSEKMLVLSGILIAFLLCVGIARADEMLVIKPAPNKSECKSVSVALDKVQVNSELCVSQGSFSHDQYVVKFNNEVVLQGIDDETTNGISSKYKGKAVSIKCAPQIIMPKATAQEIMKIVPVYSEARAKEIAGLMADSFMPIEAGRLCSVEFEKASIMKVQVIFD